MTLLRYQAIEIVRRLQTEGFQSFWVGGCVRDQLLGKEPDDYDIATAATPDQIETLFPRTIPVGRPFGVMLVVEGRHRFQVATFREESDYHDGRHPQRVTFSTPRTDARRRDFTVNGLFYDPIKERLHDWVGGVADLRAKLLRTIGNPVQRFAEDHLRLLRCARFAAQLDFTVAPETFSAVRAEAAKVATVSPERLRDELMKLFRAPHARQGLELLRESGLLPHVFPEIVATIGCEQSPEYHPEGSVFNHLLRMLHHLPPGASPLLPWAVLLHDIGKPPTSSRDPVTGQIHFYGHEEIGAEIARKTLTRLRFSRKQIDAITLCVRQHMQFKDVMQMRKATLRRLLLRPTFPLELELHRLDRLGSDGRLDIYDFLVAEAKDLAGRPALLPPLMTGRDLLRLGMKAGPELGGLLGGIREKQLQGELVTTKDALSWAQEQIARSAHGQPLKPRKSIPKYRGSSAMEKK